MDAATLVDDAELSRSRRIATALTEMFEFQVSISCNGQIMRVSRFSAKLFIFFAILLLHQASNVSCTPMELHQFSQKYLNVRYLRNETRPLNLSELIEYSPVNFPLEIENITITNHENSNPRIITLRLKTHLVVGNKDDKLESDEKEIIDKARSNLTDDSLSDIEYIAHNEGEILWSDPEKPDPVWFGYGKVEKLYTSKDIADPPGEYVEETNSSVVGEVPDGPELTNHGDTVDNSKWNSGNFKNSKWLGHGKVTKINPSEHIIYEKYTEKSKSLDNGEMITMEDGIDLDDPIDLKWHDYETIEEVPTTVDDNTTLENSPAGLNREELPSDVPVVTDSKNSEENKIFSNRINRSKSAKGRQFVFHPYIPYGKDIAPDEKISFTDVLPVKMVKFVKSMVEEAPWEQMFIKMVRMVVDQFIDKIIEKMFADKGDDFKKRSMDMYIGSSWVFPTPLVRLKRSVDDIRHSEKEETNFSEWTHKRVSQDTNEAKKKTSGENITWLDHFLDFIFPNSKANISKDDSFDRLKKRDIHNAQLFKTLITFFLNAFEKTSGIINDAKDAFRYKMLKEILPYLYKKKYANPSISSNAVETLKMSHRRLTENFIKRNDISEINPERPERRKRSTRNYNHKEEKRLWQETARRHKPQHHRSKDDCSLRKACNTGRLLSRLPSVQDILLQLRSQENEPHWDALIWGMKKKKCSRIFCKRQRSPKGSRHSWYFEEGRPSRKIEIVTEPEDSEIDGMDYSTI